MEILRLLGKEPSKRVVAKLVLDMIRLKMNGMIEWMDVELKLRVLLDSGYTKFVNKFGNINIISTDLLSKWQSYITTLP